MALNSVTNRFKNDDEDDEDTYSNSKHPDVEETIRHIENYLEPNKAIARLPFIEYTELELSEFPNVDLLNDEQISRLVIAISRLLTSYNFMLPKSTISPRLIYPILLKKLNKECSITRNGFIGIEFCSYDPNYCPFGIEHCECTDEKKQ